MAWKNARITPSQACEGTAVSQGIHSSLKNGTHPVQTEIDNQILVVLDELVSI